MALQLLDDQPELLNLAVAALLIGNQIAHQPLQEFRVGRQIVKVDAHARILRATPDSMNPKSINVIRFWEGVAAQTLNPRAAAASAAPADASSRFRASCPIVFVTVLMACPGASIPGHEN